MTFFKNAAAAVMALSLVAVPTMAQAGAASKLSVVKAAPAARVGAPTAAKKSTLAGGALIALLAGAAAIAAIVVIAEDDDDSASN